MRNFTKHQIGRGGWTFRAEVNEAGEGELASLPSGRDVVFSTATGRLQGNILSRTPCGGGDFAITGQIPAHTPQPNDDDSVLD